MSRICEDDAGVQLSKASSFRCRVGLLTGFVFAVMVSYTWILRNFGPHKHYEFIDPAPLPVTWTPKHNLQDDIPPHSDAKHPGVSDPAVLPSSSEEELLKKQREYLAAKLHGYTFQPSLHVKSKSDLIPAEGGRPVRNLIVSTWRSGSTYLESIVVANPGTFLLYEPFMGFELDPKASETTIMSSALNELFHCNFTNKDFFFETAKRRQWTREMNEQFWPVCKQDTKTCDTESYYEAACRLFPFVLSKTVRFWMNETRQLLEDDSSQIRILLLVRDPRGTMASRYRATSWCKPVPRCISEDYLCGLLESNYYAAKELLAQFPDRVKLVRYEDMMLDPYTTARQIYKFFRLTYGEEVHKFLQQEDRYSSNASITSEKPLHYWTKELTFEQVSLIQSKCAAPLRLYGYRVAQNASHLLDLDPLDHFPTLRHEPDVPGPRQAE